MIPNGEALHLMKDQMSNKRERIYPSPNLSAGQIPRKVPKGKFIWHNHVQHCVGMGHGINGFRYRQGTLPVNYHEFMRCQCGVIDLPHYSIRWAGPQKCVSGEQIWRNMGMTAKQAKEMVKWGREVNER
jgi:hypothetical protein